MRFLYNKLEQKNIVGLFANGSYKLGFLFKKVPFNNLYDCFIPQILFW